jgi:hypothetical protein
MKNNKKLIENLEFINKGSNNNTQSMKQISYIANQ